MAAKEILGVKIDPNIFRAYDVRGVYPQEINESAAYLIGRAFVKFLKLKKPKIAVGRDNRLSSPSLFKSLVKGLLEEGAEVVDIGLSTTPELYFSVANFGFDAGIEITASHLPGQWSGFKLVREKAIPISEKTGIKEIEKISQEIEGRGLERGKLLKKNIISQYLKFNFKDFVAYKNLNSLKIVIDTGNAVAGILTPHLKEKLGCQIFSLFEDLDGAFPNHNPDPLISENLRFLKEEVKKRRADFGVAFDGDGDRILFLDEKGEVIPGDLICALIAELVLEKSPNEKILYDIRSSNIVRETIEKREGIPVVSRIGHALIKEKMRKENIMFAGEFSGHYYLREHYFCEAPLFIFLKILEKVSNSGKRLSELILPFRKYYHSGEINFEIKDKAEIIKKLKNKYKGANISQLDGLRVDFEDWWFLVRNSQTEPLLRLVLEAKTKDVFEKRKKELTDLIKSPVKF